MNNWKQKFETEYELCINLFVTDLQEKKKKVPDVAVQLFNYIYHPTDIA